MSDFPASSQFVPAPGPYDWQAVISPTATGGFQLYVVDANGRKVAGVYGKAGEKAATAALLGAAHDLREALARLASHYCKLVASGDAGWDAEKEPVVIAARAALAKAVNFHVVAPPVVPLVPAVASDSLPANLGEGEQ